MLGQVFLNLTLNAVQAMPDGGAITVSAKRDGARVLVAFRDTGCGIAPDIMGKVFDPFFTTRQDGSGLGLAIVGNIITLHGGTIAAVPAVGAGAAFEIRLKGI
jgi:signal transduction histidine kinase